MIGPQELAFLGQGLMWTLALTAIGFTGGILFGFLVALARVSPIRWISALAAGWIAVFQGTPLLMQLFVVYFGLPLLGLSPPAWGAVAVALTAHASAFLGEIWRGAIQAVPKGQTEAARSLGMSGGRTMLSVTLPQAVRVVIPPLTNEFVLLLKDTSLLQIAGVGLGERELTNFASDNLNTFGNSTPLMAAAVLYLVITLPLTQLVAYLERRTKRAR